MNVVPAEIDAGQLYAADTWTGEREPKLSGARGGLGIVLLVWLLLLLAFYMMK